jgi:hypothetical protein
MHQMLPHQMRAVKTPRCLVARERVSEICAAWEKAVERAKE